MLNLLKRNSNNPKQNTLKTLPLKKNTIKILKISATNFEFKSESQKMNLIETYKKLLNSIQIPFQIICKSEQLNAENWKDKINNIEQFNFLKEQIENNNIVNKIFYIVINSSNTNILNNTIKTIKTYLKRCRLHFEEIESLNIDFYWDVKDDYNSRYIKKNNLYYKTLQITDWPSYCIPGWLEDIYNCELDIDVTSFIYPQNKESSEKFLQNKLLQFGADAEIREEEFNDGKYQTEVEDILFMLNELRSNEGKFFFTTFYITIKSKSLIDLISNTMYIKNLLRANSIKSKSCFLKELYGYKNSLLTGKDYISNNEYGLTSTSLKCFFPFISSNIFDKNGVLFGKNLLNDSLIFLDPFSYNSALMTVFGLVGSGKTFLVQDLCLKLTDMNIEVTIYDKTGEYENLKLLNTSNKLKIYSKLTKLEYCKLLQEYTKEMDNNYINKTLYPRFLIIDEGWEYISNPNSTYYNIFNENLDKITLTGRKKYQGLCIITQMIEHMLNSSCGNNLLKNASITALMQMKMNEAKLVQKELDLTDEQINFLVTAYHEGILLAGSKCAQFKVITSKKQEKLLTTDPKKILEYQEEDNEI